jgi:hypothetical protein
MSALVQAIVIGVQKAGTTALFDYLSEDPQIAVPHVKETHFFDDEGLDWSAPDYDLYHRRFPPADRRLRLEATPIYIYWPNCLERIRTYNPDIRLILALRDPVERAWSHWRMEYARGAETNPFAWCIRQGRQRLFESRPWGHHREYSYVERGYYGEQVERLLSLFPRKQLLVLKAEDLQDAPAQVLAEVRAFLGLRGAAKPAEARRTHVAREMDYGSDLTPEDVDFLRETYAPDLARLASLTGVDLSFAAQI